MYGIEESANLLVCALPKMPISTVASNFVRSFSLIEKELCSLLHPFICKVYISPIVVKTTTHIARFRRFLCSAHHFRMYCLNTETKQMLRAFVLVYCMYAHVHVKTKLMLPPYMLDTHTQHTKTDEHTHTRTPLNAKYVHNCIQTSNNARN